MKQKIVITNLRVPEADWLQVKAIAAEQGISVNEYINELIQMAPIAMPSKNRKKKTKKISVYDALIKVSQMPKIKTIPDDDFSDDDRAIYEGK